MKTRTLVASLILAGVLGSGAVQATPIQVQMEGNWSVQYEYLGSGVVPSQWSVPTTFTATIVFDSSAATTWYSDLPNHYITEFGAPTISSSVLAYTFSNPYSASSPSAFTVISRSDYSYAPSPPAPFENYQFVNRDFVSLYSTDKTLNWSFGFEFHSNNSTISSGDIHLVTGDEFMEILQNDLASQEPFYVSFTSYTFETGSPYAAPVIYTGGIGLSGSAHIVGVSYVTPTNQVLEPGTFALISIGLGALAGSRRRRRFIN